MKIVLNLIGIMFFICFVSCQSNNLEIDKESSVVLDVLLSKITNDTFQNTICYRFCHELNDSNFLRIISYMRDNKLINDSVKSNDILEQYKRQHTKYLKDYLDTSIFTYMSSFEGYSDCAFSRLHTIIGGPYFYYYKNSNRCFIYSQEVFLKQGAAIRTLYFFKRENKNWKYMGYFIVNIEFPSIYHVDKGYFVKKKFLVNCQDTSLAPVLTH